MPSARALFLAIALQATATYAQDPTISDGYIQIQFGGDGYGDRAIAEVLYYARQPAPPDVEIATIRGSFVVDPPNPGNIVLLSNNSGACQVLNNGQELRIDISQVPAGRLPSTLLCKITYGGTYFDQQGIRRGYQLLAQRPFTILTASGQVPNRIPLQVFDGAPTNGFIPPGHVSTDVAYTRLPDFDQRIDDTAELVFPSGQIGAQVQYRFAVWSQEESFGPNGFAVTTVGPCRIDGPGSIRHSTPPTATGTWRFVMGVPRNTYRDMILICNPADIEVRATLICAESRTPGQGRTQWWDVRCPPANSGEPGNIPSDIDLIFRHGFELVLPPPPPR